jgi:hypothetical protein
MIEIRAKRYRLRHSFELFEMIVSVQGKNTRRLSKKDEEEIIFKKCFYINKKTGSWNVKKPEFIPTPAFY